ncbi:MULTISPECIES: DNA-binding protein [Bacillus cereus group]|uniref:DNA-binding protein n=1 Tax=Bacillus cereus group TaxID=86661 RepID=UPI0011A0E49A|nr:MULTISPECIES: DNA-binding protein [Bacillus cereus group]MCB5895958.1 DNA-binding protein [Bacillus cereus]
MTRWINVQEAMEILEENYIKVSYKTFTDWLRKLEIAAVPSENRKEGWSIREEDLFEFIDKKRPGLRQILQEYHHLIQDVKDVKQQVQALLHTKKEGEVEYMEGRKSKTSEHINYLYEVLQMMNEEIEELKIQNQLMKDTYEQAAGEYNSLQKRVKKLDVIVRKRKQPDSIEENIVQSLDQKAFQGLLKAKFKQLFPERTYRFTEEKMLQVYQEFCNLVFPKEDKHLGIIKKDDKYTYQRTGKSSTQVKRLYNKVIEELLEKMEKRAIL